MMPISRDFTTPRSRLEHPFGSVPVSLSVLGHSKSSGQSFLDSINDSDRHGLSGVAVANADPAVAFQRTVAAALVAREFVDYPGWGAGVLQPGREGVAEVDHLTRAFPELSTADWLLGPHQVLATVGGHLDLVQQMLPNTAGVKRSVGACCRSALAIPSSQRMELTGMVDTSGLQLGRRPCDRAGADPSRQAAPGDPAPR